MTTDEKRRKTENVDHWSQFSGIAIRAADELHSLYSFDPEDRADKALGNYPNPTRIIEALKILVDVMFPGRFSTGVNRSDDLLPFISERLIYVAELLGPELERAIPFRWMGTAVTREGPPPAEDPRAVAEQVLQSFFAALPTVRKSLIEDVKAAYRGDPAALTYAEIQMAYPGLLAIASHRIAHLLQRMNVPLIPRVMSEWTHTQTGIDINPSAEIGDAFFIDHGSGVVIGATAEIGNRVKIYQGATLGARSFEVDEHGNPVKRVKRHPTVEDDVIIYANAIILGGDTVVGKGSVIGSGACLAESVPPGSVVVSVRPELQIKPAK